jgi:hypothetical protein
MNLKQIKVKHVFFFSYTSWCGLGFIRGTQSYKYENFKYKREKEFENNLIYTNQFLLGAVGTIFYAIPIFFPFFIYKEIYRLEVNLRKIDNEKKSRFYNELI